VDSPSDARLLRLAEKMRAGERALQAAMDELAAAERRLSESRRPRGSGRAKLALNGNGDLGESFVDLDAFDVACLPSCAKPSASPSEPAPDRTCQGSTAAMPYETIRAIGASQNRRSAARFGYRPIGWPLPSKRRAHVGQRALQPPEFPSAVPHRLPGTRCMPPGWRQLSRLPLTGAIFTRPFALICWSLLTIPSGAQGRTWPMTSSPLSSDRAK
jgi:hypothetical protein